MQANVLLLFRKNNTILLLRRAAKESVSTKRGYWGLVGGKVEEGETYTQAAIREAEEEVGVAIEAEDLQFTSVIQEVVTINPQLPPKTFVSVVFTVKHWRNEPFNKETNAHDALEWFTPNALPQLLFKPEKILLRNSQPYQQYYEICWTVE